MMNHVEILNINEYRQFKGKHVTINNEHAGSMQCDICKNPYMPKLNDQPNICPECSEKYYELCPDCMQLSQDGTSAYPNCASCHRRVVKNDWIYK
jgi:hypothetical protein